MKGNIYTLFYAGILGTVCALLLTAAAESTRDKIEINKINEKNFNVLKCLKLADENTPADKRAKLLKDSDIREEKKSNTLTYYVYYVDSPAGKTIDAVAVPFSGSGRNGMIKGFLALEKDMLTIRGITFYEHEETPGLGGEITTAVFQDRFKGKMITDESGVGGMLIRSGAVGRNQVDAITGATITCDKVQEMLNKVIVSIVEESK